MSPDAISRVLIVGAGAMGRQIAAQCVHHGLDVVLYDADPDAVAKGPELVHALVRGFARRKGTSAVDVAAAAARVSATGDPAEAAAGANLLIESVPELLKVKREVFALFHRHCDPQTIFATNTSMLLPSMLSASTGRPQRFAALHFIMDGEIVEIMPHPGTSPNTMAALEQFVARIEHLPLVCRREQPGYLVNTMLMALNASALTLVVNGVASFEDVDRAWMKANGVDRGPFGILDLVGIDTAWQITEYGGRWTGNAQTKKNADFLKGLVDEGRTGVKMGRGFYSYPGPAYRQPGFVTAPSPARDLLPAMSGEW